MNKVGRSIFQVSKQRLTFDWKNEAKGKKKERLKKEKEERKKERKKD